MPKLCKICADDAHEIIAELFAHGFGQAEVARASGYSVQNIRTHRAHAELFCAPNGGAGEVLNEAEKQYVRLTKTLQRLDATDLDHVMRLEAEIARNLRLRAGLKEVGNGKEEEPSKYQIHALAGRLARSLEGIPEAQKAIRDALASLDDDHV